MASSYSFDVVSDYDLAELTNAVDQARREIGTRYDFKGSSASVDFTSSAKEGLLLTADSRNQLDSVLDIVQSKLVRREVSLKVLDTSAEPIEGGSGMRWTLPFKKGLNQEKAKQITKIIRDKYPKVKPQIQGEEVRVTANSKDDLQGVMALLRAADLDFPLSFTNYR